MITLLIAFIATAFSLTLTRMMLRVPIRDIAGERSSHTGVTPRAGGVAIVLSWVTYLALIEIFALPVFSSYILIIILTSLTMSIVGLLDDVFQLSYLIRLSVQILIGCFMVYNGFVIDQIPLPGVHDIPLGAFAPIITVLWVVGFINAFNFMDGLNGLAGGGALVVCFMILLFMPHLTPISFALYGIIFALLGFLHRNFHKGEIFMGEVGSQFLGCFFAVLTLVLEPATMGATRFYIVPLLFTPFIFDASLTFIRRLIQRKNVFEPHRGFLFHRLNDLGLSHTHVALLYMFLIVLQGGFVYYFLQEPSFLKLGIDLLFYGVLSAIIYSKDRTSHSEMKRSHA